jgi:CRISPR-associated exonuclease Cas4
LRNGVRTVRSLPLRSLRHGLTGIADVVEFRITENGERPYPVEYKRGRPKPDNPDTVQLCAQALCLEEMLEVPVPEGALFYGQSKRRTLVLIDESLRTRTFATIQAVHSLLSSTHLPEPATDERCRACSLVEECMPRLTKRGLRASRYLANLIQSR